MLNFLTDEEVLSLKQLHKSVGDKKAADRIKAVVMFHDGFTYPQISKALLLDEVTIRRHLKKYQKKGVDGLLKFNYTGGKANLTGKQLTQLKKYLDKNTYLWVKDVVEYVRKKYGVSYSIVGMTKLMHRLGFVYKKPKLVPGKVNLEAQEEFKKTYEETKKEMTVSDHLYFMDSTHPQHNNHPAYGWILKGKTKNIKSNAGRKRLNLNGALNFKDKSVTVINEEKNVNTEATIRLFTKLKEKHKKGKIYIILDNASYHHSKETKRWLKKNRRIKLLFVPAYSPNLNIIERLWWYFHKKVTYQRYYEKFKDFKEAALQFFENIHKYKKDLDKLLTDNFQTMPDLNLQT